MENMVDSVLYHLHIERSNAGLNRMHSYRQLYHHTDRHDMPLDVVLNQLQVMASTQHKNLRSKYRTATVYITFDKLNSTQYNSSNWNSLAEADLEVRQTTA